MWGGGGTRDSLVGADSQAGGKFGTVWGQSQALGVTAAFAVFLPLTVGDLSINCKRL